MKNIIKKLFYLVFFKKLTLIKNKVMKQTNTFKEISSFLFIKSFLLISKILPIAIDTNNKSLRTKNIAKIIYKKCQKYFLLFFINIFTLYMKYEKKIFFLCLTCIGIFSLFIFIRQNITLWSPLLLNQNIAPNTSHIIEHWFIFADSAILKQCEEFIIGYFFPFCSILLFLALLLITYDLAEYFFFDDSFVEICLIYFLQIYTKNFLEDTQEEIIENYTALDDEFDDQWDMHIQIWLGIFFLTTKKFWFVDFHHYWPMLKKRENAQGDEFFFFQGIFNYTKCNLRIRDPNWKFYQNFYPFPNMEEKHYDENFLVDLTTLYNYYIKVILFKWHPIFVNFESLLLVFFFFCFFFFLISTLLIDIYLSTISNFLSEQMTYTMYRPFLDQYFYNWNRLMIKIFPTKQPNFLIRDPFLSQYLDLFYFIPDEEQDEPSLFDHIFDRPFLNAIPTIADINDQIFDEDDESDADEYDQLNTIRPSVTETISFTYFLLLLFFSFLFFELNRQNPIYFSGKTNFLDLPKLLPLTNNNVYSWLFQQQQLSPLFHYLNWTGWNFYLIKLFVIDTSSSFYNNFILVKKNQKQIFSRNYWNTITFEKIPPLIEGITYKQKLKGALKRKKKFIKSKIIWFGKGLIEFFLTTTIRPRFRFKRDPIPFEQFHKKKILLTFKQNRLFLLRKESYKQIFKK